MPNGFHELLAVGFLLVSRYMVDIEETLVYGVLLKAGRVPTDDRHDAVGEVAVEREIGGKTGDSFFLDERLDLVERHAHFDAERFGFVGA